MSSRPQLDQLFPDPATLGAARRSRRIRRAVGAVSILVLLSGGVAVAGSTGAQSTTLRTAEAGTHDVSSILTTVGTVEAVSQAAVAFPVAGTVNAVDVAVGDQVTVGETLATLDDTDLVQTLHTRQAALADAELVLATALDGANSSSSASTTSSSTNNNNTNNDSDTTATARAAVATAQQAVDAALTAADQALADSERICATDTTACPTALAGVSTAQQAVADTQRFLAATSTNLDDALAATTTTTTWTTSAGPGSTSGTTTVSSEELIADQKAVDAAAVAVVVAQQARSQNVVVAPIAGTVVGVGLAVGDDVTAASSTAVITVVGDGGFEVTTSVSVDDVADLATGQAATVIVDGNDEELTGEIVAIGVAPETDSTNYRVTIALDADAAAGESADQPSLDNGATATVSIVTAATTSVLAVPTSAVTVDGDRHTVTVPTGSGSASGTRVTNVEVGVVGAVWTEITGGLEAGDTVVLADLGAALPNSATATTSTSSNRNGGNAGGGMPTGGPPSGGPAPRG